jgi:hypothetical protein
MPPPEKSPILDRRLASLTTRRSIRTLRIRGSWHEARLELILLNAAWKPAGPWRSVANTDLEGLKAYIASTNNTPPVLFGFTFMVWQYFVCALRS